MLDRRKNIWTQCAWRNARQTANIAHAGDGYPPFGSPIAKGLTRNAKLRRRRFVRAETVVQRLQRADSGLFKILVHDTAR